MPLVVRLQLVAAIVMVARAALVGMAVGAAFKAAFEAAEVRCPTLYQRLMYWRTRSKSRESWRRRSTWPHEACYFDVERFDADRVVTTP